MMEPRSDAGVDRSKPSLAPGPAACHRTLGRYTLRHLLARGGMAAVYLAHLSSGPAFRKWVAIKIIDPGVASDPVFVHMFLNEARVAARLNHPNVCTVFDFGESSGTYYLAMEYLHGEALNHIVRRVSRRGLFPLEIAARVAADAARGLHSAHEIALSNGSNARLVHRDVSPHNLFVLYDGLTKVVDFGVSRSSLRLGPDTRSGFIKGKLAYLAPEQFRDGSEVDRRTDIFALGIVLWEMLAGRPLFARPSVNETVGAVMTEPLVPPSALRPDCPTALDRIVMRALQREPDDRYPTAGELARDLDAFLADTGKPWGPAEVGDFMKGHFGEKILLRESLLRELTQKLVALSEERSAQLLAQAGPAEATAGGHVGVGDGGPTPIVGAQGPARGGRLLKLGYRSRAALVLGFSMVASMLLVLVTGRPGGHAPVPQHRARCAAPTAGAYVPGSRMEGLATMSAPAPGSSATPLAAVRNRRHHETPVPRPRSPGTRDGRLNLVALPSAEVFEGGRALGYTPFAQRPMTAGEHVLRLVPTGRGEARLVRVTVRPGQIATLVVRWP